MVWLVEQIARRVIAGDTFAAERHEKAPVSAELMHEVSRGVGCPKDSLGVDRHAVRGIKQAGISDGPHEFAIACEPSKVRCRPYQNQDVALSIRADPRGRAIPGFPARKLSSVCVDFVGGLRRYALSAMQNETKDP